MQISEVCGEAVVLTLSQADCERLEEICSIARNARLRGLELGQSEAKRALLDMCEGYGFLFSAAALTARAGACQVDGTSEARLERWVTRLVAGKGQAALAFAESAFHRAHTSSSVLSTRQSLRAIHRRLVLATGGA